MKTRSRIQIAMGSPVRHALRQRRLRSHRAKRNPSLSRHRQNLGSTPWHLVVAKVVDETLLGALDDARMRTYHRDAPNMRLTSLDLAVIVAYLAGITLFGIAFRRGQSTVRDYFLGGRTAPWWALALSIVAPEPSTLPILCTPALAFLGIPPFLQFVFGHLVCPL